MNQLSLFFDQLPGIIPAEIDERDEVVIPVFLARVFAVSEQDHCRLASTSLNVKLVISLRRIAVAIANRTIRPIWMIIRGQLSR